MDIILENAGRDCTGVFQDVGHSKWAAQLLEKYRIGMLPEVSIYTFLVYIHTVKYNFNQDVPSSFLSTTCLIIVASLI